MSWSFSLIVLDLSKVVIDSTKSWIRMELVEF